MPRTLAEAACSDDAERGGKHYLTVILMDLVPIQDSWYTGPMPHVGQHPDAYAGRAAAQTDHRCGPGDRLPAHFAPHGPSGPGAAQRGLSDRSPRHLLADHRSKRGRAT